MVIALENTMQQEQQPQNDVDRAPVNRTTATVQVVWLRYGKGHPVPLVYTAGPSLDSILARKICR